MDLPSKSVLIADYGTNTDLAMRLARDFGKVMYWCPWVSSTPRIAPAAVGTGLDKVERVTYFWDHVSEADLIVFPSPHMADMARQASQMRQDSGKSKIPVWSHLTAENLTSDRWGAAKTMRALGVQIAETVHVVGLAALAEYLSDKVDKVVKLSTYAGDADVHYHDNQYLTDIWLDDLRRAAGPLAESYEFVVEDLVDGVPFGYNGFTVEGEYPKSGYWGISIPGAYLGQFSTYAKLPSAIQDVNDRLSPIFKEEESVGCFSPELCVGADGTPRLIGTNLHCCGPVWDGLLEGYSNISEIIWESANGRVPKIESSGQFVAVAEIHSDRSRIRSDDCWIPLEIPDDIAQWVKIHDRAVIDGKTYHVPRRCPPSNDCGGVIGSVVAVADTIEEAVILVAERADACGFATRDGLITARTDALSSIVREGGMVDRLREYGVEFSA